MIVLDKIKAFFKYWVYWPKAKAAEKKEAEKKATDETKAGEPPEKKGDESSSK